VGWRIGGSLTCPLAAERRGKVRLYQFLGAVVIVLVLSVIIFIHFVGAILSSHIYAQQAFPALFTGVLRTISCSCRREVEARVFHVVYGWHSFPA